MTRKYISLLLAIGFLLCLLTACPVEEPFLPPGDGTYEPKLADVQAFTLPTATFMEHIWPAGSFFIEDVNEDIPQEKTFLFDGKEMHTTLVWDEDDDYKNDPPLTNRANVYYITDDGRCRFYVYGDAQIERIAFKATEFTETFTLTQEEFIARAKMLLAERVEDISLYQPTVEMSEDDCVVEMIKYIDGYPTNDRAWFQFNGRGELFQVARCAYLGKIQNTENVQYDLEKGRKAISWTMKQVVESCDFIEKSYPFEITFEQFTMMKDGRLALQYRVDHTYTRNDVEKNTFGYTCNSGYIIYVPITA